MAHAWTSDEADSEVPTDDETFHDAEDKVRHKGRRRHDRTGTREVEQCMRAEAKWKAQVPKTVPAVEKEILLPAVEKDKLLPMRSPTTSRSPGPLRFIEMFAWLFVMTMVAYDRGWDTFQPVTLPHFDILQRAHREDARRYLQEVDPDMVMIAPECKYFSVLQNWSQRTPLQCREFQRKKQEGRESSKFSEEVAQ